jgi:peptidoglycan/xylan/chitin deacetylase (PgdA/CDA1 family)
VFVAPDILGDRTTWWDALADPHTGELDAEFRRAALVECHGMPRDVMALAAKGSREAREAASWARTAGEPELAHAVALGMTVASHSYSHANLAALSGDILYDEVARSLAWLRERFPSAVEPYLAYPYGLSSPAAEAAALRAGYRGAFLVSGGYMPRRGALAARLPRLNIGSGVSRDGFVLRMAGLLG